MDDSGEKTEQPTEKHLRESKRRGDVAKSSDLISSVLLLGAVAVLWMYGSRVWSDLRDVTSRSIQEAAAFGGDLTPAVALTFLAAGVKALAWALAPLFAVLFVLALLTGYLQVGPIFAFGSVKPNLKTLDPGGNLRKKLFESRAYVEFSKSLVKMAVTGLVVWSALWDARFDLLRLTGQEVAQAGSFVLSLCLSVALKVGLVFVALSVGDYFLQKLLHLRKLKMSKRQVMEEHKTDEGDPLIKGEYRQLHQEIMMQNIPAALKGASVVVSNPTHLAVALKYNSAEMSAPTVVAKGAGPAAARIRQVAQGFGVPIFQDVPLARALYKLEIDSEIPADLYDALIVVIDWVNKLVSKKQEV
jgi:flagellar biosynthetic protein FlhB